MLVLWHFFNKHTETNKITQLDMRGLEIAGDTFMFLMFPLFYLQLKDVYSKMTQRGYHLRWAMSQDLDKSQVQNGERRKREIEGVSKQLFNCQDCNCMLFMTVHRFIRIIIIWVISSRRQTFLMKEQIKDHCEAKERLFRCLQETTHLRKYALSAFESCIILKKPAGRVFKTDGCVGSEVKFRKYTITALFGVTRHGLSGI